MPTTLPRHAVTETPEVTAALQAAARRWPAERDRPAALLRHLVALGARVLADDAESAAERRLAAVAAAKGALSGDFGPGYLDEVRDGWSG